MAELKRLEEQEEEKKRMKEKELKEKQDQRAREIYEKIRKVSGSNIVLLKTNTFGQSPVYKTRLSWEGGGSGVDSPDTNVMYTG